VSRTQLWAVIVCGVQHGSIDKVGERVARRLGTAIPADAPLFLRKVSLEHVCFCRKSTRKFRLQRCRIDGSASHRSFLLRTRMKLKPGPRNLFGGVEIVHRFELCTTAAWLFKIMFIVCTTYGEGFSRTHGDTIDAPKARRLAGRASCASGNSR